MIGVFDSGIGGLTLLKEMMHTLPNESFLYYADTENVPYSYKTTEQIKEFVEKAVVFLRTEGCKAIVIACNTATNVAIEYLREKYDFPIIAIQPAVKVAFDNNSGNKRILACATPVTLRSDRFENLINSLDINHLIDKLPLPKLVEYAEKEIFDGPEVLKYLKEEFSKFDLEKFKFVVLGCTHFTYYEDFIRANFPNLIPIDGNEGTARHLYNTLFTLNLLKSDEKGTLKFIESGKYVVDEGRFWRYLEK
ncbi:glutamate racemase [Lacihabitans sp. LS3-19]|uniref:glutamate racemase n=1 Tax=Lacihabitans sp. LS3-19 TaxID=2487335 RepID=UPI0020CB8C29|nr:glutamate racemase [Lacihabitans sp. LS3-19]MCP9770756.1 glutamate racemase [Lacihabitans sp. LS3-19]